ncbi:MAG: LysM peptidoglycan-binding domain-containing protein [Lachnospirales bacterium]
MSYTISLGNITFPINPKGIKVKVASKNNTITLIDGDEYVIPKKGTLKEFYFEVLLPSLKYPFAIYNNGFVEPKVYIEYITNLKEKCEAVDFKIFRKIGKKEYNQSISVVVESFTIREDFDTGYDFYVDLVLKEHKTLKSSLIENANLVENTAVNSTTNSNLAYEEYTVVSGDNLWNIAKKRYGDGSKYTIILEANKDKISNPNLIYPNTILNIPKIN